MSIDDLAHDAEVEAEVLRAVAHMPPGRAQEFLLAVALKIRRSVEPMRGVTLGEHPEVVDPPSTHPLNEPNEWSDDAALINYLTTHGPSTSSEVLDGLGLGGVVRNRSHARLYKLRARGVIIRDEITGRLSLPPIPQEETGT